MWKTKFEQIVIRTKIWNASQMEIQDKADQEFHRVREYWWWKSEVKDGFRNKKSDQIDAMISGFEQQKGTVMYKRQKDVYMTKIISCYERHFLASTLQV